MDKFKINFQLFADEPEEDYFAEWNETEEVEEVEETTEEVDEQETEEELTQTQAFSKALNKARENDNKRIAELEKEVEQAKLIPFKGQLNPYNEKPIETIEDYNEYQEMHQKEVLKSAGLDENYIKNLIENHPAVKKAETLIQTQEQAQAQIIINQQINEISKLDPTIKTLADIEKMPNKEQFDDLVFNKKMDLVSAYKIANFDILTQRKANVAKQSAYNSQNKEHLIKTGGTGGSGVEIPVSVLSSYRAMGYSDEEATKDYIKNVKGKNK